VNAVFSPRKRVLCVCVENSNRSQVAEAFAHMHRAQQVEAYSAGSRPLGRINPKTIEAMREVGYDLSRHASKVRVRSRDVSPSWAG